MRKFIFQMIFFERKKYKDLLIYTFLEMQKIFCIVEMVKNKILCKIWARDLLFLTKLKTLDFEKEYVRCHFAEFCSAGLT